MTLFSNLLRFHEIFKSTVMIIILFHLLNKKMTMKVFIDQQHGYACAEVVF